MCHLTFSGQRGEIKRIRRIDRATGEITFEEPAYDEYSEEIKAFASKVNFIENVAVKGITITDSEETTKGHSGIQLEYVNGFEIAGNTIENVDNYLIKISSSIRGDVSENRMNTNLPQNEMEYSGAGIALFNSCQWVKVHDNYGEMTSSMVKTAVQPVENDKWGKPRFVTINNNMVNGITDTDINESYAFDYYLGEAISFDGNIISGFKGGFRLYSGDTMLLNNTIKNSGSVVIYAACGMTEFQNVLISNNSINNSKSNPDENKYAMKFTFHEGSIVKNVSINNNLIECSSSSGISVETGAAVQGSCMVKNFVIQNNVIKCDEDANIDESDTYAMHIACSGVTVTGNKVFSLRQFLHVQASDVIIKDNIVTKLLEEAVVDDKMIKESSLSAKWCIRVDEGSGNTIISGNILKHTFKGIIINKANNTCIYNNYIASPTGQYLDDRGLNTIYINNKEV